MKRHGKREEGRLEARGKLERKGACREKREKDRKKDDCRRARPREMGSQRHLVCQGLSKGMRPLPSMEVQGETGQVDMAVWGTHIFQKATEDPKVT